MATTRKTKRPAAKQSADNFKAKALAGRAPAGKVLNPSAPPSARAAVAEQRQRRPYSSRYPIPDADFAALKQAAPQAKVPKVSAALTKDKTTERVMRAAAPADMAAGAAPSLAPSRSANFAGLPATGWLPPDCTMAAGPNHVLLSVNSSVAIYAKSGGAPLISKTLTEWFANVAQQLTIFDPKALYDQHAGRWVLLAPAFRENPNRSVFLLSCSQSDDPLGPWRNYSFDAMVDGSTSTGNWADFPGLGVDNQALYLTANMFAFDGDFQYAKLRVIPKAGPYSGGAAPFFDFVRLRDADGQLSFTVTPCHTFGAPQVQYLVNSSFPSGNRLTLWSVVNPVSAPALARSNVNVSPYTLPPNAQQKGGGTPLNTGDVRMLHAVFRGDSVWAALTTAHNWGGSTNRASIHWFQIRGADAALVQEGIYGGSTKHYYYPAQCPDNNGNMMMVFARSGTSEFGSTRYTGRRSNEPLGKLQASRLLKAGVANYVALDSGGRNRWGDYNGVAADPANPRLVWFYSMYAVSGNQWDTWTGSALF